MIFLLSLAAVLLCLAGALLRKQDGWPAYLAWLSWLAAVALAVCVYQADANAADTDPRQAPERVHRAMSVRAEFRHLWACPATGKRDGPCPGWAVDHVIPLACGGRDTVGNMQWLPDAIKSCAGATCKDRWERKVYCTNVNNGL